jgi:hypothetical protein
VIQVNIQNQVLINAQGALMVNPPMEILQNVLIVQQEVIQTILIKLVLYVVLEHILKKEPQNAANVQLELFQIKPEQLLVLNAHLEVLQTQTKQLALYVRQVIVLERILQNVLLALKVVIPIR